jgi:hypothetical protein
VIHGQQKSREDLDKVSNRATPDEYADFNLAKMIVKMVRSGSPSRLLKTTLAGSYVERRQPGKLFFFDESKRKIGRQRFCNRLQCVTKQMKFNWTDTDIKSFKNPLKKCYFNYFRTNASVI